MGRLLALSIVVLLSACAATTQYFCAENTRGAIIDVHTYPDTTKQCLSHIPLDNWHVFCVVDSRSKLDGEVNWK